MATTTVGLAELKNEAPRLVRRAARGERIVITCHGRPHAQLGPVDTSTVEESNGRGARRSNRLRAWRQERRAFARLGPRLRRRFAGRYVAICRGRVVDSDADHNLLFERVWKRLGGRTFFIGLVGEDAPVVEVPGFEVR